MSNDGIVPWIYEDDPDARHAMADQVLREMQGLSQHPGWLRLAAVIDSKIVDGRDRMERTGQDIDLIRGALKSLREVRGMPALAIKKAGEELAQHRGE